MRLFVLGYIVGFPVAGMMTWHPFKYVLTLKQMGYKALFLENDYGPGLCYHRDRYEMRNDLAFGPRFVKDLFSAFDINRHWVYVGAFTNTCHSQSQRTNVLNKTIKILLTF